MIQYIKQTEKRILIVGDVHGCLSKLFKALEMLEYNPHKDILVSVGDLVDRGTENLETLHWFKENQIPVVKGNHDDFVTDSMIYGSSPNIWFSNGGAWAVDEDFNYINGLATYARWLDTLPYMIEIELDCGELAGVVHAECWDDWQVTKQTISSQVTRKRLTWGRTKIEQFKRQNLTSRTDGVKWLFCGHSVVSEPTCVGNQYYLDTGGVFDTLYNSDIPGGFSFAIIEPNATEVKLVKCLTNGEIL